MIKILTRTMDRCRRFIINKIGGVPREDGLAVVNKYKVEHVTYPTIKLARELYRIIDAQYADQELNHIKKELATGIGEAMLDMGLFQFTYESNEVGVKVRADLEVVDKRDKGI